MSTEVVEMLNLGFLNWQLPLSRQSSRVWEGRGPSSSKKKKSEDTFQPQIFGEVKKRKIPSKQQNIRKCTGCRPSQARLMARARKRASALPMTLRGSASPMNPDGRGFVSVSVQDLTTNTCTCPLAGFVGRNQKVGGIVQWVPAIQKTESLGEVSASNPFSFLLCTLLSKSRKWSLSFLLGAWGPVTRLNGERGWAVIPPGHLHTAPDCSPLKQGCYLSFYLVINTLEREGMIK